MNPIVSIIIPILNGEKTLAACIESVLGQNYTHFELIAVNNNSIDATQKILEDLQKKDERIKVCYENERSRGKARNTGELYAKGEIVVMIDADCFIKDKNWLQKLIQPIQNNSADMIQGFESGNEDNYWSNMYQWKVSSKFEKIKESKLVSANIDTKNFAIRKSLLYKVGGTSREYVSGNDLELSLRLARHSNKIVFLSEAVVGHHNPKTALQVLKKQLYQGYWASKIIRSAINKTEIEGVVLQKRQSLSSYMNYFKYFLKNVRKMYWGQLYFTLFTGLFWTAGTCYGHSEYLIMSMVRYPNKHD